MHALRTVPLGSLGQQGKSQSKASRNLTINPLK